MIEVSRDLGEDICNSCLDRESPSYKVQVGKDKSYMTTLHLCPRCLEDLFNESAETLNL